jgi:hypothetical protein
LENGLICGTKWSGEPQMQLNIYERSQKHPRPVTPALALICLANHASVASRQGLAAKQSHKNISLKIAQGIASSGKTPSSQ